MLRRKTHHRLPIRMEQIAEGRIRLIFGPAAGGGQLILELPPGGPELHLVPGDGGYPYLAFQLADGSYHFFTEVEAKAAAQECLGDTSNPAEAHTRTFCQNLVGDANAS